MVTGNVGSRSRQSMSIGCLTIFLIPFFLAALAAIVVGVREIVRGKSEGWAVLGFGVLFGAFAGGFYWFGRRAARQAATQAARLETFASEPWKIREDWASGRILSGGKAAMIAVWCFAGFWNAISWPVAFTIPKELAKGKNEALIALLFPLVGLGLLAWAIRATIRYRKYGQPVLQLRTIPGALGGVLAGTIHLREPLATLEGVQLRLSCINRVITGSGKHRNTHNYVRWQDEQVVQKTQDLPVFFRIPDDGQPSDSSNPSNQIIWQLEAKAKTPGVDFQASFDVPVFRTSQPAELAVDDGAAFRESPVAYEPPPESRVRFDKYARGGPEFYFPPARNLGAALGLAVFLGIWTAAIWFMIVKGAPLMFPIVFGFFDVIFLLCLGSMLLGSARITITPLEVRVQRGIPGLQRTRVVPKNEIAELKLAPGMQAGERLYHDIKLHRTDGKTITLAGAIADKREAQWLLDRMCDCLSGRG